ncbi:uncharacterized protein AMSG_01509 [Thecamonas trahens ATCC 50062]|uniref:Uncharacterized protein n=1 Tax=Thecamonas trahens ATCC 50062 TaxID=461836 RepID=A0A0L0DT92_THETB|nr:hypothetical protein AMSG_01509 [Thecamonas trahens ATCC 50062]KNC54658.1 hypothetical protein AMSG_01509 [Thecamonas trahens ATCC 50062]|eukprot:XP_013761560.1 hypothetical protein AMSG_01509 [Thecamonas trahens ATCC 50062]
MPTLNHICSCLMLTLSFVAIIIALATVDYGRKWVDQAPLPGQKLRVRVGVVQFCTVVEGSKEECHNLKNDDGSKKLYQGGRLVLGFGLLALFSVIGGMVMVILLAVGCESACLSDQARARKIAMGICLAACFFISLAWVLYAAIVFPSDDWKKASAGNGRQFEFDISWSWIGLIPVTLMTANAGLLINRED